MPFLRWSVSGREKANIARDVYILWEHSGLYLCNSGTRTSYSLVRSGGSLRHAYQKHPLPHLHLHFGQVRPRDALDADLDPICPAAAGTTTETYLISTPFISVYGWLH